MRKLIYAAMLCFAGSLATAQSLKRPDVPPPSLERVKVPRGGFGGSGSRYSGGGYMGLFDWNFSLGYIDKTAKQTTFTGPTSFGTSGQYAMFHLQESILSNYFFAKSYKKDKRVKFGFQNTFDLGVRRGEATTDSSNYATTRFSPDGDMNFFFNYQAGLAAVIKITRSMDIGYTYYPYVKSIFAPDTRSYSKARIRYSRFMAEYSFGGNKALELKYLRGKKLYIGLAYTENRQTRADYFTGATNINTNWIHLSLGRVF